MSGINRIGWLVNTPVSDVNFRSSLNDCTDEELLEAIEQVRQRPMANRSKLKTLEARARKRKLIDKDGNRIPMVSPT